MNTPHKPGVALREMTIDDLAAVYRLGETLFTADRWTTLYRTWEEYAVLSTYMSDPETCVVAETEEDERIVGFALGTLIEKDNTAWSYGHLLWFGVHEDFRTHEVAKRLLKRVTELFIQEGARMLLVDTDAENEQAIKFFTKNGFGQPQAHVYLSRNLTKHPEYERHRADEKRK
jgi:ribosomal protein S18 acetylase RimI-like enzyme